MSVYHPPTHPINRPLATDRLAPRIVLLLIQAIQFDERSSLVRAASVGFATRRAVEAHTYRAVPDGN